MLTSIDAGPGLDPDVAFSEVYGAEPLATTSGSGHSSQ
jgi:hypothetical protein